MRRNPWVMMLCILLAACGKKTVATDDADFASSPRLVVLENGEIVRKDAAGKTLWKHPVQGAGPWDGIVADRRVLVRLLNDVVAFDDANGGEVWRAPDEHELTIPIGHEVLLASRHRIVMRRLSDGGEVFHGDFPPDFEPRGAGKAGERVYVFSRTATAFYDLHGERRFLLPEIVRLAEPSGGELLIVSDKRIARLRPDNGSPVWSRPALDDDDLAQVAVLPVPGGDVIFSSYGPIHDSGVALVRLHPWDGGEAWRAACDPLGVAHSEYNHQARVTLAGDRILVRSRASGGRFDEEIALATGTTTSRKAHKNY